MALKPSSPSWLALLKDYWWLGGLVVGSILLWGSLPERVKKVEAGQASQQEEITVLREWTKETQGYLKGQQALNERLAAQQQAPPPTLPQPYTSAAGHPGTIVRPSSPDTPPVKELSDDGEVKLMRWTDEQGVVRTMCCEGTECWTWSRKTQCAQ